jgi:serine/threonine-protein kinase RIO1
MALPARYDDDRHAWALHQAEALRRLNAAGLPLPNALDLQDVAEEIEALGNEQRFQVEGNLEQPLANVLEAASDRR